MILTVIFTFFWIIRWKNRYFSPLIFKISSKRLQKDINFRWLFLVFFVRNIKTQEKVIKSWCLFGLNFEDEGANKILIIRMRLKRCSDLNNLYFKEIYGFIDHFTIFSELSDSFKLQFDNFNNYVPIKLLIFLVWLFVLWIKKLFWKHTLKHSS